MKRTTVVLPDELAALLGLERRRRNLSTAEIISSRAMAVEVTGLASPDASAAWRGECRETALDR